VQRQINYQTEMIDVDFSQLTISHRILGATNLMIRINAMFA
jgi:hypothetical protein